jgi:hypothetical protein
VTLSTEISALVGIGLVMVGQTTALFISMRKNGKAFEPHIRAYTEPLKSKLEDVATMLTHPKTGLSAINENVNEMKLHCMKTTTQQNSQIQVLESGLAQAEINHEKLEQRLNKD